MAWTGEGRFVNVFIPSYMAWTGVERFANVKKMGLLQYWQCGIKGSVRERILSSLSNQLRFCCYFFQVKIKSYIFRPRLSRTLLQFKMRFSPRQWILEIHGVCLHTALCCSLCDIQNTIIKTNCLICWWKIKIHKIEDMWFNMTSSVETTKLEHSRTILIWALVHQT